MRNAATKSARKPSALRLKVSACANRRVGSVASSASASPASPKLIAAKVPNAAALPGSQRSSVLAPRSVRSQTAVKVCRSRRSRASAMSINKRRSRASNVPTIWISVKGGVAPTGAKSPAARPNAVLASAARPRSSSTSVPSPSRGIARSELSSHATSAPPPVSAKKSMPMMCVAAPPTMAWPSTTGTIAAMGSVVPRRQRSRASK